LETSFGITSSLIVDRDSAILGTSASSCSSLDNYVDLCGLQVPGSRRKPHVT
jgi:hypothetical protein